MLTVSAPAKINLVLEVLGEYRDDYHQISSIVQTISLCDTLKLELAEEISFSCSDPVLESNNLVVKAARLLKGVTGCKLGARVELCKHIPWGVGLGGGSSDAAAALLALNELWGLRLPTAKLASLASMLGSDIPFFIYGGTALVEGRGERVRPLPPLPSTNLVLLVPPLPKVPDKTRQLYRRLDASHYTKGEFVGAAVAVWCDGGRFDPSLMFNVFQRVVFDAFPELEGYKRIFEQAGASSVYLAGSGPALFSLVSDEVEARELCSLLEERGLECYVVSSSPANR